MPFSVPAPIFEAKNWSGALSVYQRRWEFSSLILNASGSQRKETVCSLVPRCTEYLVFLFQRNTEITYLRPHLRQRKLEVQVKVKLNWKGKQGGKIEISF